MVKPSAGTTRRERGRRRNLEPIGPILRSVISGSALRAGLIDYAIFTHWADVVGAPLARQTRPLRVQGGVLWVYVQDSTLLYHLTFLVPRMCERIREEEPESRIRTIRFTLNPE